MIAAVKFVDRLLTVCERVFHVFANSCLAIMLTVNIVNIASRAVFDKGIIWVFPWSVVLFVWMTFFGFFVLYRKRRDITIDVLIDRVGPVAQKASRLFVGFVIVVLMAVMLYHGPQIIASQVGTIEMVGLQRYVMSVPLFVSCLLIFLNYVIDIIETFLGNEEVPPAPSGGE
jgi:TRAP-type C4-dicarboxylate transport system permease small subunit